MIHKFLLQNTLDIPNNLELLKKEKESNHGKFAILTYHEGDWRPMNYVNIFAWMLRVARLLPSGDRSAVSQDRNIWPLSLSPLALSPKNATSAVSALNSLICLAPPYFS